METLSQERVNELRKEYTSLEGKNVSVVITGLRVTGKVIGVTEDRFAFHVEVEHEPVRWGDDIFTKGSLFARKCDNWGSLNNLQVL